LNSEIYQITIGNGAIKTLTDRFGPDNFESVSPDGTKIAYTGFEDTFQGYRINRLYVMNADGSNSKLISQDFDRSIQNVNWAASGKGLYFQYDDKGETKVGFISLSGDVNTMVGNLGGLSLGRPYNAASYTIAQNGKIAYTLGKTNHPADLGTFYKNNTNRLTQVNQDLFSFKNLGNVEEIWWESSFDQKQMQGWVVTPPDFDPGKKYPMILEIHGGPFASYGAVFSAEIQLYAAAGYVVLYTNPRGSSGYGEEFGNLIHHDYPNHDYDDLMSGVDALIQKGYVDEQNLFVTGGSGGGVLTAWIVGKTDRFKAAVVAKPVINWYSFVLYADNPGFFYKYWFPNKPWEDPSNYLKRSPLTYVGNITTPTMLLTGEEDYRTPIAESEQFYAALKLQKVETAMVRIPGASHGIANKPSNLIAKIASVLAWFDKYREGK
jgi:acylaminoacyl-peptidase